MRPTKNERALLTVADMGPYQLWLSDEYTCPRCGHQILTGYGLAPIAHHYESDFTERVEAYRIDDNLIEEDPQ